MDMAKGSRGCKSSSSQLSAETLNETGSHDHEEAEDQMMDLRRGPWTVEEDLALMNYIANHGEGRWNSLAGCAGLKRTGKSCRLRWLNYLRPDVRRGNITLEEQLLILELHSRWGNRWSKIAQHLPGRTDNEIKNYWRTRVQKHAKQLKCDVNSKQFKDTMRYIWMPRLVERIQAAAAASTTTNATATDSSVAAPATSHHFSNNFQSSAQMLLQPSHHHHFGVSSHSQLTPSYNTPENSSTAASSDSFGTQVSPVSDLTDYYTPTTAAAISVNNNPTPDNSYFVQDNHQVGNYDNYSGSLGNQGLGLEHFQTMDEQNNNYQWGTVEGGDISDNWWNVEDMWFLQQHLSSI
ncbi:hypothetical protein ACFX13_022036 [Malus domestica]|uniref:MYB domain class transcription factor n=1 Tax=Malus domestica TaxID=3750 RepID=A0A498HM66_MALDO|nr:transcription factor MYB108 [Malus domestica]RXH71820.1 hypothetical protein DVH24_025321 [Malus domestica]RXH71824.1 hypothetical protein DVH24_025325 [Malus domestica]RXI09584.1 hypothetical protein DVH24_032734 [Malus domestica]WGH51128.1 MYB78 [Malus sieversii]